MSARPLGGAGASAPPELREVAARRLTGAPVIPVAHGERLVALGARADGTRVVVKVDLDGDRHRREAEALGRLAGAGVAVPAVLDQRDEVTPIGVVHVLELEHVAGPPLSGHAPDERWAEVGVALAGLHRAVSPAAAAPFAGNVDGSFAAHLERWLEVEHHAAPERGWLTGAQADRMRDRVWEALAEVGPDVDVCLHGDCSPFHWLLEPGRGARPIDLADAGRGDPVYDLVVLTIVNADRLDAVLDGYGADASLRARTASVGPAYRLLRLAGSVSWLDEHGFDPRPDLARLRAEVDASPVPEIPGRRANPDAGRVRRLLR